MNMYFDPDQAIGSICECERGPRVKYRGGCAECESIVMRPYHRPDAKAPAHRVAESEYVPSASVRGRFRWIVER
jgi:hypothetical protein